MKKLFCLTDKRKFKAERFIVIDVDSGRPMFFDGEAFVFSSKRLTARCPVEVYERKQALSLINISVMHYNHSKYLSSTKKDHKSNYSLMPVYGG